MFTPFSSEESHIVHHLFNNKSGIQWKCAERKGIFNDTRIPFRYTSSNRILAQNILDIEKRLQVQGFPTTSISIYHCHLVSEAMVQI